MGPACKRKQGTDVCVRAAKRHATENNALFEWDADLLFLLRHQCSSAESERKREGLR